MRSAGRVRGTEANGGLHAGRAALCSALLLRSSVSRPSPPPPLFLPRPMNDEFIVTCPYCGEEIEIYIEPDVRGSFVQDCEVCCNPWTVRVTREDDEVYVEIGRADGSE